MENIYVKGKERSPCVDFRFDENYFALSGESYPEDTATFFGPIINNFADYCSKAHEQITFDVTLAYFNTSSAKVLMNLFQILENCGKLGASVLINWAYQKDDEVMLEFGEDFSKDLNYVQFCLIAIEP